MKLAPWLLLASLATPCRATSTLARVEAAKTLVCGLNTEEGDYSRTDDHGARPAFEADLCRAVAVAILGPKAKITLKEFPDDSTAIAALLAGQVDLLPTLTLDFTHASGTGLGFSRVVLWDGVGFMVPITGGVDHPEALAGKKICLLDGTEVEESTATWFRHKGLAYDPFPYQEEGEMEAAFVTGACAAIAADQTRLAATRIGFGSLAGKFRILPEVISTDPLAAAYAGKEEDRRFGEIVDWVMEVIILAEERSLTASIKLPAPASDQDITIRRLRGKTHEIGARLGLSDDWAAQVIAAVGNYGEIFARDLGPLSPMGLQRARNRLERDGGLLTALPLK